MKAAVTVAGALVVGILFLGSANASAQQANDALIELLSARCLRCELDEGTAASWDQDNVLLSQTAFGKAGVVIFDSLDIKAGKARIIGRIAADVLLLASPKGLTFIEETGAGNLVFTTVFGDRTTTDSQRFVAVMSRHVAINGPIPSQYHGTCTIVE